MPDNPRLLEEPDNRLYLVVGLGFVSQYHFYDPVDYPNPHVSEAPYGIAYMNYNYFKFPASPVLSQMEDIPEGDFCTAEEALAREDHCRDNLCMCIQVAKFGLNEVRVEEAF